MTEDLQSTISTIIQRAPEWLRHDLVSKDKATRQRAEEALAAIIANALGDGDRTGDLAGSV